MSLTCFEVAKATARNEPISQYLVNDDFSLSTIDINDICDVIKADIIYTFGHLSSHKNIITNIMKIV